MQHEPNVELVQDAPFDLSLVAGNVKQAMKDANAKSRDLWYVPYEKLVILPDFNVRVHDAGYHEHVRNLANLMKANGYRADKPMTGYVALHDGEHVIHPTDGHCRHAAIALANSEGADIKLVPVVATPQGTNTEDLIVGLVTSNSGKELSPYEVGVVCKRLTNFGWDNGEIARRLGLTGSYVGTLLMLQGAPLIIRGMLQGGLVSADNAADVIRKHGDKAVEVLERALGVAKQEGKARVTRAHLPGAKYTRAINKRAVEMHEILNEIRKISVKGLPDALWQRLQAVLDDLDQVEKPENGNE